MQPVVSKVSENVVVNYWYLILFCFFGLEYIGYTHMYTPHTHIYTL